MCDLDHNITDDFSGGSLFGSAMGRWTRTWVEIDLAALGRNWDRVAARLPQGVRIWACVKKDGYGHGLLDVARTLAGRPELAGFCVATLEEAVALRAEARSAECGVRSEEKAGTNAEGIPPEVPILILSTLEGEALEEAVRLGVTLPVTDLADASAVDRAAAHLGRTARIHLKLDTGMGRLGRQADEIRGQIGEIRRLSNVRLEAVFSHLAWGNSIGNAAQRDALERFRSAAGLTDLPIHWGGSDALSFADALAPGDGLRVGIALYRAYPDAASDPVMIFKTRVIYRRRVPADTAISYGSTFVTTRPSELAVIGAGYGNGLLRTLSGSGEVLIAGRRCPVLGRVCMDQTIVDVTDLIAAGDRVEVGDEVVLFGAQTTPDGRTALLPATEQARHAGTISYELCCLAGMLNPRRPA